MDKFTDRVDFFSLNWSDMKTDMVRHDLGGLRTIEFRKIAHLVLKIQPF